MNYFSLITYFIFLITYLPSIEVYAQSVATLPMPTNYKALSSAFLNSNNILICAKTPQAAGTNGDFLYSKYQNINQNLSTFQQQIQKKVYDLSQKKSQYFPLSCLFVGQLSDATFFLADQTTYKFYSFSSNQVSLITSYKISSNQGGIAFYKNLNDEQIYLSFNDGSAYFGRANNLYELRYCDQTPVSDIAFVILAFIE
ncbi:transmembrane protein, putative (macronuclear) [Tetrahymena thermophila SB210]|uniref:Transmembrane protein, putative n=1 Tax=Tetrahymena thermophila (strain SB210) TaxID=312017 RepID=Q23A07_TETTS|nr:transmembrane protein, putative [Tetrahymena thermophila SB210]EAR93356.1 transmembrane protein, putative [Tetrahymena thermophila SB210]|eukprot:XP_001013601.1 transmembrane protein, putative [Tetrahymena thermophila SB210]